MNSNRIASTVSRRLRGASFPVMSSNRRHSSQGLTVRAAGNMVSVLVDYGTERTNTREASEIIGLVSDWQQVSSLRIDTLDDGAVYVRFDYSPLTRAK